jgi:2'-5' RNA ligase
MNSPGSPIAQQNSVTAIDTVLEPDETMMEHAQAVNTRLLGAYPDGFALDATHQPHITMLQQFVRTAELDKAYAAVDEVFAGEKPATWKLTAFKAYYIPAPPIGVAGIVIEPTEDLLRLQQRLIDATAPYTVTTGTVAAFASAQGGRDIQDELPDYVANFADDASGKNFNPHVTTGVGTITYLDAMLAEPFAAFTFSPAGAAIYQLGTFGTAQKKLHVLPLSP